MHNMELVNDADTDDDDTELHLFYSGNYKRDNNSEE